ncbi:hypothetical protein JCM6882_005853 [Rhodosporidiobolus microsporus]
MHPWRGGGPSRPSFPSSSSTNTPSSSAFGSSAPTTASTTAGASSGFSSERGRGRGRGRGAARGTRGAGGGGSSNLSWRKPSDHGAATDPAGAGEGEGAAGDLAAAAAKSAFAAFEDPSSFGSTTGAGAATGGGGGGAFSAFGSGGGSAFGSGGTFGGGGGAFGGGTTASAFPTTAAASTSAFNSTTTSMPLFRATSTDSAGGMNGGGALQDEDDEEEEEEDEDQLEEDDEPEAAAPVKRAPGQISTLEVLGEDSDARRKRFEATLPNNRYLELKPLREAQRLAAIKSGLIPDPSKPMRLDEARDFEGTCEEMCPEWEREEREYQNNVDPLERYPGTNRIDPVRAVKAFHRPAAGNDQPLPSDVRPPRVLASTLNYLFHTLLPTQPLAVTHPFLRDRTRSVRQDFTVQNVRGASAIECHERIARYHILALGALREQSGFSESQEMEQLRKVLTSLNEFYDDARLHSPTAPPSPNEPEFRAYSLLAHLRDHDTAWQLEALPHSIFAHPLLQTAITLHRLAQKSRAALGERAGLNAASRFFKLVAHPSTPYLFGCILTAHFSDVRRNALEALRFGYVKQHSAFPLKELAKVLGCDDEDEVRSVCEQLGVAVKTDEQGNRGAELFKGTVVKATTLKPRVSKRLVEAKRGSTSYQDVIDGRLSGSAGAVQSIPHTPSLSSASASPSTGFSFAPSPAAVPAIATASASSGFSNLLAPTPQLRAAAPSFSPIPTPVPTPPPPGLNASAPTFVPSSSGFGGFAKPAAAAAAPLPAAPASAAPPFSFAAAPSAFPSASAPAATPFSFAPTPVTAAPAPPPPSAAAPPTFSFAPAAPAPPVPEAEPARPTKRLPPSSLRTAVTASPFVPSHQPFAGPAATAPPAPFAAATASAPAFASAIPPLPLISPRISPRISPPSARRVSVPLTSPHPGASSHAAHLSSALSARRRALVDSLAHALTREIVLTAVAGPARRAAAEAMKARWAAVRAAEEAAQRAVVEGVAREAVERAERLVVREAVVAAGREEKERRRWLREWVERTGRQVERREAEEVRAGKWREVVRGLEGARRRAREEEEEMEGSDEELVEMEDEEDDGMAGVGDEDLDFGGLSIGGLGEGVVEKEVGADARERDRQMAEKLQEATATRSRIWQRGTFLNLLASHLSTQLSPHYLSFRPTYTTLLYTPSTSLSPSPFASWLACKFDLDVEDGAEGRAEMDTPYADVEVRLADGKGTFAGDEAETTGLIVFDCTKQNNWAALRATLSTIVEQVTTKSLFAPALLIVLCPDRTLSSSEETSLRLEVANNLNLSALVSLGVAASSVYIAHLDNAEAEFDGEAKKLFAAFSIREERVPVPLREYAVPLFSAWRNSLASAYSKLDDSSSATALLSTYIALLQSVVHAVECAAHPPLSARPSLPSFADYSSSSLIHSAVQAYVSSPSFRSAGHFPDVATALAQRPAMAELPLARLLLDHLASFTSTFLTSPPPNSPASAAPSRPTTLRETLTSSLPSALASFRSALSQAEDKLRPPPLQQQVAKENEHPRSGGWLSVPGTPTGTPGGGRKRRASRAPLEEEVSSPTKKPSLILNGNSHTGRSATPSPELDPEEDDEQQDEEEASRVDRLSALEGLMRDARALLSSAA